MSACLHLFLLFPPFLYSLVYSLLSLFSPLLSSLLFSSIFEICFQHHLLFSVNCHLLYSLLFSSLLSALYSLALSPLFSSLLFSSLLSSLLFLSLYLSLSPSLTAFCSPGVNETLLPRVMCCIAGMRFVCGVPLDTLVRHLSETGDESWRCSFLDTCQSLTMLTPEELNNLEGFCAVLEPNQILEKAVCAS